MQKFKARQLFCLLLTLCMLSSMLPQVSAFESKTTTSEGTTFNIPVINEVGGKEKAVKKANPIPMPLMSTSTSTSGSSGGSISSGGSTSTSSNFIAIKPMPAQTAQKGSTLVIDNFIDYVSTENFGDVIYLSDNYSRNSAIFKYTKNGVTKTVIQENSCITDVIGSIIAESTKLNIPVPKELETGAYTVEFIQYADKISKQAVGTFSLTVTDGTGDVSFSLMPFTSDSSMAVNPDKYLTANLTATNAITLPAGSDGCDIGAVVIGSDNQIYKASGFLESDGKTISPYENSFSQIPSGQYTVYFYTYSSMSIGKFFFGPVTLNVANFEFYNKYYSNKSTQIMLDLNWSNEIRNKIEEVYTDQIATITTVIKNKSGVEVAKNTDAQFEDFYSWYGYYYFNILDNIAVGEYNAFVTIKIGDTTVDLGSAPIVFTDAHIINYISIKNYDSRLSPQTQSFYVQVEIRDLFTDLDNMSIKMVDSQNNIVAETTNKGLSEINSSYTSALFKMNVTSTLYEQNNYSIVVSYNGQEKIVNNAKNASISVSTAPMVVRNELIGDRTVKIYTENVLAGAYKVVANAGLIDERSYDVEINDQGIGQFNIVGSFDTHPRDFQLKNGNVSYGYFYISVPYEQNNYSATPSFIAPSVSSISGFKVNVPTPIERLTASDIQSAVLTQNSEVVANMTNFVIGSGSYYSDGDIGWNIQGDITNVSGKLFAKGFATFKMTFTNGYVASFDIPVTDESFGFYGSVNLDNSIYFYEDINGLWVNKAISTNKASFTIDNTNITSGTVKLYEYGIKPNWTTLAKDWIEVETKNISDLTKTTAMGYTNKYTGSFNTEISDGKSYLIRVTANDESQSSSSFTRYLGKRVDCYESESINATGEIFQAYFTNAFNISNINNITFKLVDSNNNQIALPATIQYTQGNTYFYGNLNFTSIPKGNYKLLAFENGVEIKIGNTNTVINHGITTEVIVGYTSWKWVDNKRVFTLFGSNLDRVNDAKVKLYREVKYQGNDTMFEFVKDVSIPKPYEKTSISIPNSMLEGLAGGKYTLVYVLDGVAKGTVGINIYSAAPVFNADFTLNSGIEYTNKANIDVKIDANGYTKMKYGISEVDLANAEYVNIVSDLTVDLGIEDGSKTVYIAFANDDGSKTTVVTKTINLDTKVPVIENVTIPTMGMWDNNTITFTSNEMLKNAFLTISKVSTIATTPYKTVIFSLTSQVDGKYIYTAKLYYGQDFLDKNSFLSQIIAIDRAGNRFNSDIRTVQIAQHRNISGTVRIGQNVASNIYVYLYNGDNYYGCTWADFEGKFTFNNIKAGDYTIKVEKRNYTATNVTVAATDFANGDITGKDIELTSVYSQNATITVNVTDFANSKVQNVNVNVNSWETDTSISAKTDANGVATITVPYKDGGNTYVVKVNKNGFSDYKYEIITGNKTFDFKMPQTGTITGVVKSGEVPVANTQLNISGINYNTWTITNEKGEYTATVYSYDANKSFTVSIDQNANFSGQATATLNENFVGVADISVKANIRIKGSIKNSSGEKVTEFKTIYFNGNGKYTKISVNENGEFETASVLSAGEYTVTAYGYAYKEINKVITITEKDLESPIKELNLVAERLYSPTKFNSGYNSTTANTDVASKGETVTVMVKYQNDGNSTLSNLNVYATLPDDITTAGNSGATSKDITSLKADEKGNLALTFKIPDNYDKPYITIPGFIKIGTTVYPLGSTTIEIISATIDAPQVVTIGESFKVFGEATKGGTLEIMNFDTKDVLATTKLNTKWYFTDVTLDASAKLVAKITIGENTSYSKVISVTAESTPIKVNDIKVSNNGYLYSNNPLLGIPTFSASVNGSLIGWDMIVKVKFDNIQPGATVTYSFADKKDIVAAKDGDYYTVTITNWSGRGTKKITANVNGTEFIIAEVVILIDPSGYITDKDTNLPIAGVSVLLKEKVDGNWVVWDAAPHKQQNPMVTNALGYYGWDVPEGEYQITVTKDGYETKVVDTYNSRDYGDNSKITVLPVRTDVDIKMTNLRGLELNTSETKSVADGRIKFVFNKPIKESTLTTDNFKILSTSDVVVAGALTLAENGTVVLFKPAAVISDVNYKVSIKDIEDLNNNKVVTEVINFAKTTDIYALATPTINYANDVVTITFANAIVNSGSIIVETSGARVAGTYRVNGSVITFIPDTAFASGTTYNVKILDTTRTTADNYLATTKEQAFTTPGGGSSTTSGSGGGGGVKSVATPKTSVVAGDVVKGTKITLTTDTKDAQIYYTIDGSTPTDKSTLYSDAIVIDKDMTIKAIAIKKGISNSSILAASYTIKKDTVSRFTDTVNYAWAEKEINSLAEKGIIKGVSDVEFAPQNNISRADYMILLVRMLGLKADTVDNFSDVTSDKYYYNEIGIAKALGLTTGVGYNEFNPEDNISRQDMFVLAYRILKMQNITLEIATEDVIKSFEDYNLIADYAKEAFASLVKNVLIKGSGNFLNPQGNATRAETSVFIYRLDNLK